MIIYVGDTKLDISEEESWKLPSRGTSGKSRAWITDKDGKRYHVRRASCGLPRCMCALDFVKERKYV